MRQTDELYRGEAVAWMPQADTGIAKNVNFFYKSKPKERRPWNDIALPEIGATISSPRSDAGHP
jgi:hypothetical protein